MHAPVGDVGNGSVAAWPPGTVCLEDMRPSASKGLVLQPRPTSDPNDPLNWPNWRKYLNFSLVCFYVVMVSEFINAATPTWGPMNKELGFSYQVLNDSYAIGCAFLGIGAIILIPFALKLGRRPLYLFSTILQFALSIWSAKMKTVPELMLINVLSCGFGALAEVIVQMTVADVFFVHQRGRMNSIYIWLWNIASSLGALIAGFITLAQGWRWVWWWNAIFFGTFIFFVGFGYEETKFIPVAPADTNGVHAPGFALTELQKEKPNHSTHKKHAEAEEVIDTARDSLVLASEKGVRDPPQDLYTVEIDPRIPKKTYWQRLSIITTTSSDGGIKPFLRHMYRPLILLATVPAVTYTALAYGILVGLGDVMVTTLSTFMTEPPYSFNSSQIGLMSMPRIIGMTIGSLLGGFLSDWVIVHLARRNNGIYEPEMRLWCIVPFLLFIPAGSLLFAFGLNDGLRWPIIAVGYALYYVGIAPINSITITYLTDSYKDIVGDALVGVTVVRNTFSTCFIFVLHPWIESIGIKYVLVTILLIASAILVFVGALIRWGRAFRARTATRYQRYASEQYEGVREVRI